MTHTQWLRSLARRSHWLWGAAVAMAACSTTPPAPPAHKDTGTRTRDVVVDTSSTFAALESDAVLALAMEYPRPAKVAAPAAPLSLTASDGTGLELVRLDARAVVDGPIAFTELELRFRNPEDRVIEGRFSITLPPEATVSRLAMRLDTGWMEAEVVERQAARRAYEDFLHRRQDPALLEKEAGNEFSARIFPIPARGDKDIILSYSQPLASAEERYVLPLRGLPRIEHLRVSAMVGQDGGAGKALQYRAVTMEERGQAPTRDFEAAAPAGIAGVASGELLAARIRPALSAEREALDGLVLLFDTSASRAPGFADQVAGLGALVAALGSLHDPATPLAVAAFDQSVAPIYRGTLAGFGQEELDALLARRPLGASDVGAALQWAGSQAGLGRVVLVTDAIATAGASEAEELLATVRELRGAVARMDVVLSGGIRDRELARRLVRGTLPQDGVVLDADAPAAVVARRISQTTVSGIEVSIPGAEWVWPATLDGVQPGDEVLVFASLGKGRAGASARVSLSGTLRQDVEVPLASVPRPLLERAAIAARIAQLSHARDALDAERAEEREELKKTIIALSTRYRVLSDLTALLVLESEADYVRFGIDRRALADILTVGPGGVQVVQRSAPVVLIAARKDTPKMGTGSADKKASPRRSVARSRASAPAAADEGGYVGGGGADPGALARNGTSDARDGLGLSGISANAAAPSDDMAEYEAAPPAEMPRVSRDAPASRGAAPPAPPPAREAGQAMRRRSPASSTGHAAAAAPVHMEEAAAADMAIAAEPVREQADMVAKPAGPPPYSGKLAEVMDLLARAQVEAALVEALRWNQQEPGDLMALVALGEALEARGNLALAARAYGSIVDLFPSRADMRRFAGERLERLGEHGDGLAADTFARAVAQRPDHLTGHRLLAYALLRQGAHEAAFAALEAGLSRSYPSGRFLGGVELLREDLGIVAAAWLRAAPAQRETIEARLQAAGGALATRPSLRFVLYWETDANDVDFHIHDGKGGHAYYRQKNLPSGGRLYHDVTTGYGPECFAIDGVPAAYPYQLRIHYYSRGPMGFGMGKLEIMAHDGQGGLRFEQRPYVVMNDGAYVDLGTVTPEVMGKVAASPAAEIAY